MSKRSGFGLRAVGGAPTRPKHSNPDGFLIRYRLMTRVSAEQVPASASAEQCRGVSIAGARSDNSEDISDSVGTGYGPISSSLTHEFIGCDALKLVDVSTQWRSGPSPGESG